MNKRPLVPSFLQKLDEDLLRNKPGAWTARTHLVFYFATMFALLLFVFCYFAFFDAKQSSSIAVWNVLVGLVCFTGFIFWLIYLLRFNVFKRYGNWFALDALKDFALYFTAIAAMVAVCFVPSAVETMRANQQFGNEEVVQDINEINTNACRLEYNLLPLKWKFDTCKVVDNLTVTQAPADDEEASPAEFDSVAKVITQYVAPRYRYIDTAELRHKLANADSLLKINDSVYVFYECPDYAFVNSYMADEYTTTKILTSADIYNSTIKNYSNPNRAVLLKRMEVFKTKYASNSRYGRYYEGNDYVDINDSYDTKISKKYSINKINNGIYNVVEKKYAWKSGWPIYLRTFYYISFLLTMLVFIFRHSTVKTFFLSLLTAVLLTIITGLLLVISDWHDVSGFSFIVLYYVVFAILALTIFKTRVRSAVQGIGLNLFLFMTPFMPLIFVALNQAMRSQYYVRDNEYSYDPEKMALYILIAEMAGPVLLLILLQPLFKKLYRKWYSSPEE
jgi:hypothetical protein